MQVYPKRRTLSLLFSVFFSQTGTDSIINHHQVRWYPNSQYVE